MIFPADSCSLCGAISSGCSARTKPLTYEMNLLQVVGRINRSQATIWKIFTRVCFDSREREQNDVHFWQNEWGLYGAVNKNV